MGIAGLASNIVGLVLFHDHGGHGHSHVGSQHSHFHDVEARQFIPIHNSEEAISSFTASKDSDYDSINDVLLERVVRRASISQRHSRRSSAQSFVSTDHVVSKHQTLSNHAHEPQTRYSKDSQDFGSLDGHNDDVVLRMISEPTHKRSISIPYTQHHPAKPTQDIGGESGHHSHKSLNMQGVFLHILGDALGNIGVIATALFIWLTDFSWRFYADPVISLIITGIILSSALPLVKTASFILLQGVPRGISLLDVKNDILQVLHLTIKMSTDNV